MFGLFIVSHVDSFVSSTACRSFFIIALDTMSSSEREQTLEDEKATMEDQNHQQHAKAPEPKQGFLKRIGTMLDLDLPTFLLMLK